MKVGLFDKLKKPDVQKKTKPITSIKGKVTEEKSEVELVPVEEDKIVKEIIKPKVIYVKRVKISTYNDLKIVSDEVSAGNIVIVDLSPLISKPEILSKVAEQVKMSATTFGWDIAMVCKDPPKILVTPQDIKIARE
ncbi:cell division protein SepF [Thermococcus chitonophagus]|uniref:cell division protein SepF n=1 Tax=Thermococcus chitonophagus TaxID=54262 RepID=UPI000AF38F18